MKRLFVTAKRYLRYHLEPKGDGPPMDMHLMSDQCMCMHAHSRD